MQAARRPFAVGQRTLAFSTLRSTINQRRFAPSRRVSTVTGGIQSQLSDPRIDDPVYCLVDEACRGKRRLITTPTGSTGKTVRITARPATIREGTCCWLP
jgi:hypothetical protein